MVSVRLRTPLAFLNSYAMVIGIFLFTWVQSLGAQAQTEAPILWSIAFSSDGNNMAYGGSDGVLHRRGLNAPFLHDSLRIVGTITRVVWHPKLPVLAVCTQLSAQAPFIIDYRNGRQIPLLGIAADGARGMTWNSEGTQLALGDNDGRISIFDSSGTRLRTFTSGSTKSLTALAWQPKSDMLVALGDSIRMLRSSGEIIHVWAHRTQPVLLLSVAWHPSGRFFVTGDYGDTELGLKPWLQFWNADGSAIRTVTGSEAEYRNMEWNASGSRLATTSDALRIWSSDGRLQHTGSASSLLWGLSWRFDGRQLLSSSLDGRVQFWNARARLLRAPISGIH